MSIFDNLVFDEFTLLEGSQAEAYKKRKADEKVKSMKKDFDRINNYRNDKLKKGEMGDRLEDLDKYKSADKNSDAYRDYHANKAARELQGGKKVINLDDKDWEGFRDKVRAIDTVDRHQRRHPKHECTFQTNYLFESDIEII